MSVQSIHDNQDIKAKSPNNHLNTAKMSLKHLKINKNLNHQHLLLHDNRNKFFDESIGNKEFLRRNSFNYN